MALERVPAAAMGLGSVSARTEPRFTRDVDLVIAVSDDQGAEEAVHSLQRRGYHVSALVEQDAAGRLATARLVPPGEGEAGVVLDVLFASSGIEPEIAAVAEVLEILPGLRVIHARGFQRGRDLSRDLEQLVAQSI